MKCMAGARSETFRHVTGRKGRNRQSRQRRSSREVEGTGEPGVSGARKKALQRETWQQACLSHIPLQTRFCQPFPYTKGGLVGRFYLCSKCPRVQVVVLPCGQGRKQCLWGKGGVVKSPEALTGSVTSGKCLNLSEPQLPPV